MPTYKTDMLIPPIVGSVLGIVLSAGWAWATPTIDPATSASATIREQVDQDNRTRELAGQQAKLARSDALRGDQSAAQNRLKKAIEFAAQIQGIRTRTVALVNIATVQAEVGDAQGALLTANSIQSPIERDSALRIMALDRAKAGDLDSARLFSNAIQDNSKKTDATTYIEALQSAKPLGY